MTLPPDDHFPCAYCEAWERRNRRRLTFTRWDDSGNFEDNQHYPDEVTVAEYFSEWTEPELREAFGR